MMTYRLGCDLADRVVGVASIGGTMAMDDCDPEQPVSILAIHGTEDGQVSGTSVRLITVQGGGHAWFSSDFGGPAAAVDATK